MTGLPVRVRRQPRRQQLGIRNSRAQGRLYIPRKRENNAWFLVSLWEAIAEIVRCT